MNLFEIDFLDHVALRVSDLERSAAWYAHSLGLTRHQHPAWGPFPIMMLAGESGVALFPGEGAIPEGAFPRHGVSHLAFRVSREAFEQAQAHFREIELPFTFQDHTTLLSIYVQDPDGYTVELMCMTEADNSVA